MKFSLRHPFIRQSTYVVFPSGEEQIQDICRIFNLENTDQTSVIVDTVHDNPKANILLKDKEFKLDELNYLTKRMDSFAGMESDVFYAMASAQKLSSGKDLINLTFNTHCYSVLSSFESLNQQGKMMYLNEREWVREDELRSFDGEKYIKDMIAANPSPQLSAYGFVYPNSNQPEEIYQGKTFPHHRHGYPCITVVLSQGDVSELVGLPTPQTAIDKVFERMEVNGGEVAVTILDHDMQKSIADIGLQRTNLSDLNAFAQKMLQVGKREYEYLSNLVEFTGITTPEELDLLMETMQEFELYPNVRDYQDYGVHMICESGHFEYDDNLEDYIDFEGYGRDRAICECGAFTDKGYLVYHGYNQHMEGLLHEKFGLVTKTPAPMIELKLYMPLKVISWQQEDNWGNFETSDYEEELCSSELIGYEDDIRTHLTLDGTPEEVERGLMAYYNGNDTVNSKVQKYVLDVEEHRGRLFGVAVLTLHAPLDCYELNRIKDEITGQASDGLGESLEQQEIIVGDRAINVSLWNSDGNWSLKTAEEMGFRAPKMNMTMGGM